MKVFHRVFRFCMLVTVGGLGFLTFLAAMTAERWQVGVTLLYVHRVQVFWLGVELLLLAALYALTGLQRRNRARFLSFDNEGGRVSISTDAIADYIAKLGREFPSIIKMKPRVVPLRNAIDIILRVKIKAGPQIHEICQVLQQRVRESMSNGLGISEVRRIEVSVTEINVEHKTE